MMPPQTNDVIVNAVGTGVDIGSPDQQQDQRDNLQNNINVGSPGEPYTFNEVQEEIVIEAGRPPASSVFSISDFLSRNQVNGFARTSRYLVQINGGGAPSNSRDTISLLCESIDFPGRDLSTEDVRIYGPVYKVPVMSVYPDITMTLLCDINLNQKAIFERWMNMINPNSTYDFTYRDDYVSTITIKQLDVWKGNSQEYRSTYEMQLLEAFPTSVQSMQASWSDDSFHKLQVTFAYTKWVQQKVGGTPSSQYDGLALDHQARVQNTAANKGLLGQRDYFDSRNIEHRNKVSEGNDFSQGSFRGLISLLQPTL